MLSIRKATLRDIDEVVDLRMKLLYEMGRSDRIDGTEALRTATRGYFIKRMQTGEFTVWLAESGGDAVSMTCIHLIENPPEDEVLGGTEGYVMDIYTEKEWRGRGIATSLLEQVILYARGMDAKKLVLDTIGTDRRIYEKQGFRKTTSEMELLLKQPAGSTG
ncbi:MAG: GNAT family N-acetyltransferase [Spirochaetes bacterium]|nr:GNAT family N-acetyltransferase [Spirochaetota bacterium]